MNNYDGYSVHKLDRVTCVVKVYMHEDKLRSGRGHFKFQGRDVYIYDGDLDLDGPDVVSWEVLYV